MPACFQLYKKGSNEPESLQEVDVAICNALNMPVDKIKWCYNWYDVIGFRLALGWSFDKIRQEFADDIKEKVSDVEFQTLRQERYEKFIAIVNFLEANYTTTSFYQIGK